MSHLIERLLVSNETDRIALDYFHAVLTLIYEGVETEESAAALLGLTENETSELHTILTSFPQTHGRALIIRSVLVCNEINYAGYQTAAEVRAKLGLPTP